MEGTNTNGMIDPNSGFCSLTKTFHSQRPKLPLPPPSQPLSVTQFTLSLLRKSSTTTFLINAVTGQRLTYADFVRQINSLAFSLHKHYSLSKNDGAFILAPNSFHIPILNFSLLSLGVVVSPSNPLGSVSEISRQIQISKPSIAFATSHTAYKLPPNLRKILIDSPEFLSLLSTHHQNDDVSFTNSPSAIVNQSDSAAILYSSGTTGKVKGVLLTHRNVLVLIAVFYYGYSEVVRAEPTLANPVELLMLPLFHCFGFFALAKGVAMGQTMVLMERFDFETMLKAVEKYKVTYIPVSPPVIVALTKSSLTKMYDLSSLRLHRCGGAPLGKEAAEKFRKKFPNVQIWQGYAMTECGLAAEMRRTKEAEKHGSVGRLSNLLEAKIVDSVTGEALPPGQRGELWLRGPTVMKGYVGNHKATAEALNSEGWLKTGDLCYFDSHGFLFVVDRLKELIKYKAYQVPPAELEHLLQMNPQIADAAVIPYPDEEAGQIPMAFAVRKPGSDITEAQLMDFIAKQVAPYKKIRRVAFINSIPKSPTGKILRRELVTHALSRNLSKL